MSGLMALDFFGSDENEGRTHLELSQMFSAAGALATMFLGSLFIWKSYNGAKLVLLISLVLVQLVLLDYSAILMLPFALIDVLIIALIISSWKSSSD